MKDTLTTDILDVLKYKNEYSSLVGFIERMKIADTLELDFYKSNPEDYEKVIKNADKSKKLLIHKQLTRHIKYMKDNPMQSRKKQENKRK